ncbi:PepSY-associated TM helix domain-containing protein [Alteromonas sp. AMM-1]|uniref:PepSY-associated TM helix domain-containing protein n=1 Tax=Alteromonas sp. AMM-1 TaxID=3394233 RepID=UPI0039A4F2B8
MSNVTESQPRSKAKALLNLHSWSGIALGILLYAVIFTGTVAVVSDEVGEWSNSNQHQQLLATQNVDEVLSKLAAQTNSDYLEEISAYEDHRQNLVFFFHTHKQNPDGDMDEYGVQYKVNANGNIAQQQEGFGSDIYAQDDSYALSRFLVSIHTELHLPAPWGLILTGILGLAMLIAAVSGFMMHRHLFTDLFTIRKQRDGKSLKRDSHTVAGTWSIPFAILLAFTGSFFSFATAFGLPAMAVVAFGGDQEAMMHTLVGEQQHKSEAPQPSASVDTMLSDAVSRQSAVPTFIAISHWGTESASMMAFFMPSDGEVGFAQLVYNATNGDFVESKPQVGTVPSAGSVIMSLIYPVHFGTFAGFMSKIIWISLGVASCYVIVTGLQLYAFRNEKQASGWRWFSRLCVWGFCGLPLCSLSSALGFFVSGALVANQSVWTPLAFVLAAAMVSILALTVKSIVRLQNLLLAANGLLCLLLPVTRYLTSEFGWLQAIEQGNVSLMFIDAVLLLCSGWCFHRIYVSSEAQQSNTNDADAIVHDESLNDTAGVAK